MKKKNIKRLEELETEDTKYCLKCRKVKPLFEFNFSIKGRKFAMTHCIACQKEDANERHVLCTYGITLKDYDKILEKQGGGCKICGTKTPSRRGRFHIDHEHSTSKIRGLLCMNCNRGLGHFKDDIKILTKAITYLVESK